MKIWAFGDSYTEPFHKQKGETEKYFEYKGYIPNNYVEIVAQQLDLEYENFGKGGRSNRTILSQFINVLDQIQPKDILIFGWSSPSRFRISDNNGDFFDIVSNKTHINDEVGNFFSAKTIEETIIMRDQPIFLTEILEYMKWVKKTFSNCTIVNWTWYHFNIPSFTTGVEHIINYQNSMIHHGFLHDIYEDTNGLVKDYHYSELGHKLLSEKIINYIKNNLIE